MNNVKVAGTGKRFLAFVIDMILISLTMNLMMILLKGPYDSIFHLDAIRQEFYDIGVNCHAIFKNADGIYQWVEGVTDATKDYFYTSASSQIDLYARNSSIMNIINALVASSIFQFIVPLCLGEGRTIGKLLMKLRVVKKNGAKLDFLGIFLRGFVGCTIIEFVLGIPSYPTNSLIGVTNSALAVLALPFIISGCLVLISNSKRALHDYIAGTVVVYAAGWEPKQRQSKQVYVDPYRKSSKGFEYIDVEALERNEKMKKEQEELNKQRQELQKEVFPELNKEVEKPVENKNNDVNDVNEK